MHRQLGAALLVLVMAGAQASLVACQIACAARDGSASADGSGSAAHTCHRTQPSDGPLIDAEGHACGHDEELPPAAHAANSLAPADAAAASVTPTINASALHRAHATTTSPRGRLRLPVPLRI